MKKWTSRTLFWNTIGLALLLAIALTGCVEEKDPVALNRYQQLRTFHVTFIDNYTDTNPASKTWNPKKFNSDVQTGDSLYDEALTVEKSKKSPSPEKITAITTLKQQFDNAANKLQQHAEKKDYFLTPYTGEQYKTQLENDYDKAIKGDPLKKQL